MASAIPRARSATPTDTTVSDALGDCVDPLLDNAELICAFLTPDIIKSMSERDEKRSQILYDNLMITIDTLHDDVVNELSGIVSRDSPIWKHYITVVEDMEKHYLGQIAES